MSCFGAICIEDVTPKCGLTPILEYVLPPESAETVDGAVNTEGAVTVDGAVYIDGADISVFSIDEPSSEFVVE